MKESERKEVWAAIRRMSVQEKLGLVVRLQCYFDGVPMTDGPGEDRLGELRKLKSNAFDLKACTVLIRNNIGKNAKLVPYS